METPDFLYGRELLQQEARGREWKDIPGVRIRKGFEKNGYGRYRCSRCGTDQPDRLITVPCSCGEDCFFCANCLNMGRIKKCSELYSLPEPNLFPSWPEPILAWKGNLSTEQARASEAITASVKERQTHLIWAVAGSGKTEMIFKGIESCLRQKGRVCIASPRVDVCLELAPRIKAAFPNVPQVLLYGNAEESYSYTPLVIATTHQLYRFREAFDCLIIDEIDSFPYHNDRALQFGAEKARKKESALIYLTATPSRKMQQDAARKKLKTTILPARYHGFALPEPVCRWTGDWQDAIRKRKKTVAFLSLIRQELAAHRRFLLFLPNIRLMLDLEEWLHELFPEQRFTSVSAEDEEREEKVLAMRREELDFLMTTTILERGVTFRDIDVIVLGAEDRVFTEASLVQIAGRAGRHKDYPAGLVVYAHHGCSRAMKGAVRQIRQMNRRARERGLLNGDLSDLQPDHSPDHHSD